VRQPCHRRDRLLREGERHAAGMLGAGQHSWWPVQDEELSGDVRVEVVAADEREYLAPGEALDGFAEVGFHRLLEEVADMDHASVCLLRVRDFSAGVSTSCMSVTRTCP
jgi:hypothetical protein